MLRSPRPHAPPRGIATVLILLLVGLSLSAAVLGTAHYIRSQQQQDVAAHAQTQAQMKAWTGAELVRQYLQQLQTENKLTDLYAKAAPFDLTLTGDGVTDTVLVSITNADSGAGEVTARITGVTAPNSPAEARAVLEVVYGAGASGSSASQCGKAMKSSTVLRGDVSITGGTTSITSGDNYSDVAIDGSLTIQSASQAVISGCTKGNITMSGGGIDENATLSSQNGTITIESMAQPTNATLWARAISVGNTGSANYNALKAGAYLSNVVDAGNVIVGTAYAGGKLIASTAGTTLPWKTGTVTWETDDDDLPIPPGDLLITLNDGGEYLVDMTKVTIDVATGTVSGAQAAAQRVNALGSLELPDIFTLHSTAIAGGGVSLYTLKVNQIWGYDVSILGWGGEYTQVWSAGNFNVVTGTINELLGGGDLWATNAGSATSNFPTFKTKVVTKVVKKEGKEEEVTITYDKAHVAGKIYYNTPKKPLASTDESKVKVAPNVVGTSQGLPGAPFCDTRTDAFDAAAFRSTANYIFEFDANGKPILTIQHMKASDGSSSDDPSIDRANIDLTAVDPAPATALNSMTLRRINGVDFLGCNNQSPSNQYNDALSCLRSATPGTGWNLKGITKFPPGIALFIGPVTIDGVSSSQGTLRNTILSTGGVTLTGSGHGPLVAPNFVSPVSGLCDGSFYPANLCDKSATPSQLAEWIDADGNEHRGLPLANLAIGTNKQLSANSWAAPNGITGNVLLGESVTTGGATLSIAGTLTVGANSRSNTTIQQGGLQIETTNVKGDRGYMPGTNCTPTTTPGPITMKWTRYM